MQVEQELIRPQDAGTMKILITGGAGFIGSHTADALIEQGHDVRLLDNLQKTVHPRGRPAYLNPKAEFINGDVCHADTLKGALKDVEAVYHLAAYQDYLTDFSTFLRSTRYPQHCSMKSWWVNPGCTASGRWWLPPARR
jgi:hypothetical protein